MPPTSQLPRALIALLAFAALCAGCAPEIRWRGLLYDAVHADARRDGRPTFTYLRAWYLPACTRFEDTILKDPEIVAASDGFYAALIEFDSARHLTDQWGVQRPPAVVILDPESNVLAKLEGDISKAALLAAMTRVRNRFPPATAPAATQPRPETPATSPTAPSAGEAAAPGASGSASGNTDPAPS